MLLRIFDFEKPFSQLIINTDWMSVHYSQKGVNGKHIITSRGGLEIELKKKTFLHMWWSPPIPPIESQCIVHKEPVLSAVKVVV